MTRCAYKRFIGVTDAKIKTNPKAFWTFVNKTKCERSISNVVSLHRVEFCNNTDIVNAFG